MIHLHPNLKDKYTGTCFGILALRGFQTSKVNREAFRVFMSNELEQVRQRLNDYDRKRFCAEHPVASPYVRYNKKFKKSYPVMHQIESILGGKDIPDTFPLIQALFLTEIQTSLLIAGHDLEKCLPPFHIKPAEEGESYVKADGQKTALKPGDIIMSDQVGIILSVIYGQDDRTRVTDMTTDILYQIDGVPGIERDQYEQGLRTLLANLRILHPNIEPVLMEVMEV